MRLQTFDVVVVPFPYSDRLAEKRRPALVVSHPELPARLARVWLAMITSVPQDDLGDMSIRDLEAAGLSVASTVRASKLATIDTDRVIRLAGRLSDDDQRSARRALMACAGF